MLWTPLLLIKGDVRVCDDVFVFVYLLVQVLIADGIIFVVFCFLNIVFCSSSRVIMFLMLVLLFLCC